MKVVFGTLLATLLSLLFSTMLCASSDSTDWTSEVTLCDVLSGEPDRIFVKKPKTEWELRKAFNKLGKRFRPKNLRLNLQTEIEQLGTSCIAHLVHIHSVPNFDGIPFRKLQLAYDFVLADLRSQSHSKEPVGLKIAFRFTGYSEKILNDASQSRSFSLHLLGGTSRYFTTLPKLNKFWVISTNLRTQEEFLSELIQNGVILQLVGHDRNHPQKTIQMFSFSTVESMFPTLISRDNMPNYLFIEIHKDGSCSMHPRDSNPFSSADFI